ncbi:MAG: VWA domain-containing protein [Vicinamibacterales bacterium]
MRLILLPAIAAALSISLFAQQDSATPPAQTPVFRSGTSMVALNVSVFDGRKPVSGLSRDDFEVYEDGVRQQVNFFESRSVPMDLILLLDTSSSMIDKMETVHRAARGFMKMLRPEDRGAVVAFADSVKILQPLSSDAKAIEIAIEGTTAQGSTSLRDAIYVALKEFCRAAQSAGDVRRQAIAVLSDGEDTKSLVSHDDVMALARQSGVNIYTIGLQSQPASSNPARFLSDADYAMRSLAQETGAQSFFPKSVTELKGVYDDIAGELSLQYSIGYSPSNTQADGRFRRILVRIANNPAFRPRARTGYLADSPVRRGAIPLRSAPR